MVWLMLSSPDRNGFSHITLPSRRMREMPETLRGSSPVPQLRPERAEAQLRMREEQVVHPLGHVVRELVADREAEPEGLAVLADKVDAGDLGLFARVLGEGRGGDRLARRRDE
ncbi:MAG: hypothetical protein QM702_10255 [Rubrivivax sp.]